MSNTASLKKEYTERIAPALKAKFQYTSTMQIPVLKKIVVNQGLGGAVADKKIIDDAINELTAITSLPTQTVPSASGITIHWVFRSRSSSLKSILTACSLSRV